MISDCRSTFLGFSILLVCLSLPAAPPRLLLKNPGFEVERQGAARDWKTLWGDPGSVHLEQGTAHSGRRSLLLDGRVCLGSVVLDNPGGLVSVSGWIRTRGITRGDRPWSAATISIAELDRGKTAIGYIDVARVVGTRDWTRYTRTFALPESVRAFQVRLEYGRGCQGRAWFDGIQVTVLPDPYSPVSRPFRAEFATVHVDATKVIGAIPQSWRNLDGGRLPNLLLPSRRRLLPRLGAAGFRYVRLHDCLSRKLGEQLVGGWKTFDSGISLLLKNGLKPVVVLGSARASTAAREKMGGGVSLDTELHERLIRTQHLVQHCLERFGTDEIRQWFFEVDDEFSNRAGFAGRIEDDLALYDHTVAGALRACPDIRIGGGAGDVDRIRPLAEHCVQGRNAVTGKAGVRLDFLSWHVYCGGVGVPDFGQLQRSARAAADQLSAFPSLQKRPRIVSEWSCNSVSNPWMDDSYRAPFILKGILAMDRLGVDRAVTFCLGDSLYDSRQVLFRSGAGLFTNAGFPKAPFHVFELLNRLQGVRVSAASSNEPVTALAAWDSDGNVLRVMAGNTVEDPRVAFTTRVGFVLRAPRFAKRRARAQVWRVTPVLGNAYDDWIAAGKPRVSRAELIAESSGKLRTSAERKAVQLLGTLRRAAEIPPPDRIDVRFDAQGSGVLTLDLPVFSVCLLEFRRGDTGGP